ncbi:MAG: UDP-N-acetylglucosamine 1-carboxyvinyltransferase, partial [Candidatus Chloroheliales bacterium]
ASLLLMGPMLARVGEVRVGKPGGDYIGRRPVDTHFLALEALGATAVIDRSAYYLKTKVLHGADIFLNEASVTGTENAIMAAVLAEGETVICNAACEPHVQELCLFLNGLGANISGIGSNQLHIEGVTRLHGGEHTIESDHIEVGSYIGLAAVTGGELLIRNAAPQHLRMINLVFRRLGVMVEVRGEDLFVPGGQELRVQNDLRGDIPYIDDAPWPGFPADLMSIALTMATQASGTLIMFEKMFDGRLFFVDKLNGMGARIILCDPHRAVIIGPSRLHGEELSSPDIRAGMAILLAALAADGVSVIRNVQQIDRGYERIEQRLQALGARIERVAD